MPAFNAEKKAFMVIHRFATYFIDASLRVTTSNSIHLIADLELYFQMRKGFVSILPTPAAKNARDLMILIAMITVITAAHIKSLNTSMKLNLQALLRQFR